MTKHDLSHLHPPRDPSDPEDSAWYPGDNRSFPERPPEQLDGLELELLWTEHAELTNCACECGWCTFYQGLGGAR